jgi:hypothetical protein
MGQSGAIQTRSEAAQGRMWQEAWPALPAGSADVQALLTTIENLFNTGATCTLSHYLLPGSGKDANGGGGGAPKVNGPGQSGTSLMTYGWTAAAAVRMKAGDCFTVPGCDVLFRATADVSSDGSGLATIPIEPPIVAGSSPTNSGVLTIASATLTAVILDYTDSTAGPDEFIGGLSVTFREAP